MADLEPFVHVPHYPLYSTARAFLQVLNNQPRQLFFSMRNSIMPKIGTPQEPEVWSNPLEWIPRILEGDEQAFAHYIWEASNGLVNPRHTTGIWLLCSSYELIDMNDEGNLYLTERGMEFLNTPFGRVEKEIDFMEGLLRILETISDFGPAKRSELLKPFTEFLDSHSNIRARSTQESYWIGRINNLLDRQLIERNGITYQITQDGLTYLARPADVPQSVAKQRPDNLRDLRALAKKQADDVKQQIIEQLADMNPYAVERLVQSLLQAMGYENVEVTSAAGDGGVDVVADIEVGITLVREVVQVKRRKGTIGRPFLDQLRGSLHRFDATRGTIITTGKFSKDALKSAFERGAAPITLIDGERLVELLIEHSIGARKRSIDILEFQPQDFKEEDEEGLDGMGD